MKVHCDLFKFLHLDKIYSLLHVRGVMVLKMFFQLIDIHCQKQLNDLQFVELMHHVTDLSTDEIYRVFEMLDLDGSGEISFDEFYLLMCILLSVQDGKEKQFIYRHSRAVFDLLDEDCSGDISGWEFENFGFLFNFHGAAIRDIFREFDVSGDQEIDYKEFRMFAMACVDKQTEIYNMQKEKMDERQLKRTIRDDHRHLMASQREGNKLDLDVVAMDQRLKKGYRSRERKRFLEAAICNIL